MNLLGGVLLVSAFVMLAVDKAGGLFKRQRSLSAFIDALRIISSELGDRATPIPELFSMLSDSARGNAAVFFRGLTGEMEREDGQSLCQIWTNAVTNSPNLDLSSEQRQELCRLGPYLGRMDARSQTEAVCLCAGRLEKEYERAAEKCRGALKFYLGLGISAGLMLAVTLL